MKIALFNFAFALFLAWLISIITHPILGIAFLGYVAYKNIKG